MRSPHSTGEPATSSHTTAVHRSTTSGPTSRRSYLVAPAAQIKVSSPSEPALKSGVDALVRVTTTSPPRTASSGSPKTTGHRPAWRVRHHSAGVLGDPDRPQTPTRARSAHDRTTIPPWLHPRPP